MSNEKGASARDLLKATNQKVRKQGNFTGMNSSEITRFIGQYKPTISQVLPKHLTADRVLQVCVNLLSKNPDLKKCRADSVISAVIQASELGFNPVQALGQCYFVPYGEAVQMQIGYKGYIELARRSGQIKSLFAYCVYEGDLFEYEYGLNPTIEHKPSEAVERTADKITHAYAVAHYKNGGHSFVVLTKAEVEKLRLRNGSQKRGLAQAWKTDYDKMAMAKAIKQLAKFMPLSDEMQTAIVVDESVSHLQQFSKGGTDLDNIVYDVEDIQHEEIEANDQ